MTTDQPTTEGAMTVRELMDAFDEYAVAVGDGTDPWAAWGAGRRFLRALQALEREMEQV